MQDAAARLVEARHQYLRFVSPCYDEVLDQVAEAITATGSIGKADIGALLFWKRLRADVAWAADLHSRPDRDVRDVTARAVLAVNDSSLETHEAAQRGRAALSSLPGFSRGDALASALLVAAAPGRMAVYDRRAHAGLDRLGLSLSSSPGRYGRYLSLVEGLRRDLGAAGHAYSAREVDTALFWLGGRSKGNGRTQ